MNVAVRLLLTAFQNMTSLAIFRIFNSVGAQTAVIVFILNENQL